MAEWQGFWSYVRADDQADGGRIAQLAKDVVSQFEMLTGETVSLFLDKDAIQWGENWRDNIDKSLSSIAFFIAVLTPRYFMSAECRRELQFFARRATNLGVKELVLPLLYVDVPSIHKQTTTDDLVVLVRTFRWEDWRDLRFTDVGSETYRRGVARLANRLVEVNKRAEDTGVLLPTAEVRKDRDDVDETPGFLDRVGSAEQTLPKWQGTLEAITAEIERVGEVMKEATADIQEGDAQGKGFAARLLVARRMAVKLAEPVDRISSYSNEFASQLHDVDEGFRALIDQAPAEIERDPNAREAVCEFFGMVRRLSASAHEGLSSIQQMINDIRPVEAVSRDLRPPLRRLRQGLTRIVEARGITDEWVQLLETSRVDCSDGIGE